MTPQTRITLEDLMGMIAYDISDQALMDVYLSPYDNSDQWLSVNYAMSYCNAILATAEYSQHWANRQPATTDERFRRVTQ